MNRLPPTSVPNLQDYITRLTRLGAAANQVITLLSFDNSKTGPTVLFDAQGWLDAPQYARAAELGSSMSVHRMLEQEWGDGPDNENEKAASQMAATLGPRPAHLAAPSTMVDVANKALAEKAAQIPAAPPAATAFPTKPLVAQAPEPPAVPEPPTPPTPEPLMVSDRAEVNVPCNCKAAPLATSTPLAEPRPAALCTLSVTPWSTVKKPEKFEALAPPRSAKVPVPTAVNAPAPPTEPVN